MWANPSPRGPLGLRGLTLALFEPLGPHGLTLALFGPMGLRGLAVTLAY